MLTRTVAMTGMLGAAVGVPYAISNAPEDWSQWVPNPAATSTVIPGEQAPPAFGTQQVSGIEVANSSTYSSPARLGGSGFLPLNQALRLNVSKNWVYQHWDRKSTGLADPQMFGVRVPLVTGTGMADLGGSLSYYFNAAGGLDKIRFRGTTADTSGVIAFMQRQYGVQWRSPRVPGEQLLQSQADNKVVSQLRTFPEPVLWSTKPHGSFGVELEINRPGSGRFVEPPGPKLEPPPAKQVANSPPPEEAASAEPAEEAQEEFVPLQPARRSDFRWPN